jgi:hypothetical protein
VLASLLAGLGFGAVALHYDGAWVHRAPITTSTMAVATESDRRMGTFVLVHGAWSGAHGFRHVRRHLQRPGTKYSRRA